MKIIALQGRPNCGKTTVITKLYQKLCALYKRRLYKPNNQDGDFTAIFEIDTHTVGITSIGDYQNDLIEPFEIMENNHCQLCVVCCHTKHTKGGSKLFVESKAKQYNVDVVWYTKGYIEQHNAKYDLGKEIDEINDIQAKILLQEILKQI